MILHFDADIKGVTIADTLAREFLGIDVLEMVSVLAAPLFTVIV
jgi:hypothetical protein